MNRITRAYQTYLRRYAKREEFLARKGKTMALDRLSFDDFEFAYQGFAEDNVYFDVTGKKVRTIQDIVGYIVAQESTYVSLSVARNLRQYAREHNYSWKDAKILDIASNPAVKDHLSELNETLKVLYPNWTGTDRARWISHNVYGSD